MEDERSGVNLAVDIEAMGSLQTEENRMDRLLKRILMEVCLCRQGDFWDDVG